MITSETRHTRRGTQEDYFLNCHRKSGPVEKVPIGTLMEEAVEKILDTADAQGIPIINQTARR